MHGPGHIGRTKNIQMEGFKLNSPESPSLHPVAASCFHVGQLAPGVVDPLLHWAFTQPGKTPAFLLTNKQTKLATVVLSTPVCQKVRQEVSLGPNKCELCCSLDE